jgi:hypothetical protein
MEVMVGGTTRTSAKICDMCSGINIESLSSPEGYSHFYKQSNLRSCLLCGGLFTQMRFDAMKDTPVRIKLSRKSSSMGSPTLCLRVESGTYIETRFVSVITREGRSL